MRYLIGIDDTDNLESRGTGYRARMLGSGFQDAGLAVLRGITRHQLLVSPVIRYTSHNSSACLLVDADTGPEPLVDFARTFLLRESAPGSDAGLCIAPWEDVAVTVQDFGERAKREVLSTDEATALACKAHFILEGLTGDGGGVIGSLAAVGLRAAGNDGRFLWLPGIRDLTGAYTVDELLGLTGIEVFRTLDGAEIPSADIVDLGAWCRPILEDGQAVLLVEPADGQAGYWRVAAKERIKQESE